MTPALAQALHATKYVYLTTYGPTGRPGTVPVWCWLHDGAVYFTTQRASLKARRIGRSGRVTVEGRAEWVDGRDDLEAALLAAYRRKYPLLVPLWMGSRIRRGLAAKTSVLIRVTPETP